MTQTRNATISPSREESNHTLQINRTVTLMTTDHCDSNNATLPYEKGKGCDGEGIDEEEYEQKQEGTSWKYLTKLE